MEMLKCCLNPKVLAGLAVVGVALFLFAPNLVAGALPLLIGLICPLSMLLMMRGMGTTGGAQTSAAAVTAGGAYTCPMHPVVRTAEPGRCPQCSMALVASTSSAETQVTRAEEAEMPVSRDAQLGLLRARLQVLGEQQTALRERIAQLQEAEASAGPPSKALQEAERVAQVAAHRQ